MAKLKPTDFNKVLREHSEGRDLVNAVIRAGGDNDDYKKAYEIIKFPKTKRL